MEIKNGDGDREVDAETTKRSIHLQLCTLHTHVYIHMQYHHAHTRANVYICIRMYKHEMNALLYQNGVCVYIYMYMYLNWKMSMNSTMNTYTGYECTWI